METAGRSNRSRARRCSACSGWPRTRRRPPRRRERGDDGLRLRHLDEARAAGPEASPMADAELGRPSSPSSTVVMPQILTRVCVYSARALSAAPGSGCAIRRSPTRNASYPARPRRSKSAGVRRPLSATVTAPWHQGRQLIVNAGFDAERPEFPAADAEQRPRNPRRSEARRPRALPRAPRHPPTRRPRATA